MKTLCDHSKHTDFVTEIKDKMNVYVSQDLSNSYFSSPYIKEKQNNLIPRAAIITTMFDQLALHYQVLTAKLRAA